jgi:hypothetical protein
MRIRSNNNCLFRTIDRDTATILPAAIHTIGFVFEND